ncbi:cation:dicarboxylate symporter family transporter [Brevibacillus sp. H7]|uniref:cation:dicarboxylate symporter family transporter n=1 Tax=Brevibacillus sp. H7 TaxID=3349138 RepID=UPI003800D291
MYSPIETGKQRYRWRVALPLYTPAEGVTLMIGIDRIIDMVRTSVNVMGPVFSSVAEAKWDEYALPGKGTGMLRFLVYPYS